MKVSIIGGGGRMGQWFARFLLKGGLEVILVDKDLKKLRKAERYLKVEILQDSDKIRESDLILLAIPINSFEKSVSEIVKDVRPEQIIIDITSIKAMPVEVMHKYFSKNLILGTHPMFGPRVRSLVDKNFILTPISKQETEFAEKVKNYLAERGANVTLMTPLQHDQMMSLILGLSHFIGLVAADTLAKYKELSQYKSISGLTFKKLLNLIKSILSQNPDLYAAIQMSLQNLPMVEKQFQENARIWANIVRHNNKELFVRRMTRLQEFFMDI